MTSEREYQAMDAIAKAAPKVAGVVLLFALIVLVQRLDAADEQEAQHHAERQAQAKAITQNAAPSTGE